MYDIPRSRINVEDVTLFHPQVDQPSPKLRDHLFEFEVGNILVVTELEVFPLLFLVNLFPVHDFLHVLLFFDNVNDVSPSESIPRAVRPSRVNLGCPEERRDLRRAASPVLLTRWPVVVRPPRQEPEAA